MTLGDIDMLLGAALKGVLANRFTAGQGSAVATIAKAMLAIREAGALEDRLAELERRAGITDRRSA